MGQLSIKRAYEQPSKEDGVRILVDRLWPRGIKKENLELTEWSKEIAPSNELRKAFHQEGKSFNWFSQAYQKELSENINLPAFIKKVKQYLVTDNVTLIYSAKDIVHNQAVILKQWLDEEK